MPALGSLNEMEYGLPPSEARTVPKLCPMLAYCPQCPICQELGLALAEISLYSNHLSV